MARIVLSAIGSYGDVYPFLSLGMRLASRGHEPVLAAPEVFRASAVDAGLAFAPVRPDVDFSDAELFRRVMDPRRGVKFLLEEKLLPSLRDSYTDLQVACRGADLLLSHSLTYAAPILGEASSMPWISVVLQPMGFCSPHDPPALAPIPWLARLKPLGPRALSRLLSVLKRMAWSWSAPIRALRNELGLSADADPLWEGQFSPFGTLALFSRHFGEPQPDWPVSTTTCGFCFHDRDFGGDPDADRLEAFLKAGSSPVVVTLGSSAALAAGDFYESAADAVGRLGGRAVLIASDPSATSLATEDVLVVRSARIGPLFEAASVVVHAGGVGTTGHAMQAGRPQLVVPFGGDQFDSAVRVSRRGLGLALGRRRARARTLARHVHRLQSEVVWAERAGSVAARLVAEDGPEVACNALGSLLERSGSSG